MTKLVSMVVVESDAHYPHGRLQEILPSAELALVHPPNEAPSVLYEEVASELRHLRENGAELGGAVLALGGSGDPFLTVQRRRAARILCESLIATRANRVPGAAARLVITARKSEDQRAMPALLSLCTELTEQFGPRGIEIVLDVERGQGEAGLDEGQARRISA